jgi:DNA-binding NarL/FixJ family response regulator
LIRTWSSTRWSGLDKARELIVLARARRTLGAPVAELAPLATAAHAIALSTGARLIDQELDYHDLLSLARVSDGLTAREQEVIDALATGATNRQIAHDLQISEGTVRKHLEHAYAKLGVTTRTAAVTRAAPVRP